MQNNELTRRLDHWIAGGEMSEHVRALLRDCRAALAAPAGEAVLASTSEAVAREDGAETLDPATADMAIGYLLETEPATHAGCIERIRKMKMAICYLQDALAQAPELRSPEARTQNASPPAQEPAPGWCPHCRKYSIAAPLSPPSAQPTRATSADVEWLQTFLRGAFYDANEAARAHAIVAALARGGVTNQLAGAKVPREPTEAMIAAGRTAWIQFNDSWQQQTPRGTSVSSIWIAMHDAARFTAESPETKPCPLCQGTGTVQRGYRATLCKVCFGRGVVAGDSDQDKQDSPEGKL